MSAAIVPRSFVQTNNDAVRLFEAGKYQESTALLELTLMNVRSKLAVMPPPESEPSTQSRHRNKVMIQGIPLNESLNSIQRDNSTGVTFFDRCFLVANGNNGNGGTELNGDDALLGDNGSECKVCALVLYNMGVSHHLAGLVQGSHEELDKAFKVYQMALEFLQLESANHCKDAAEDQDSVFLVLSMALMNNVAHIQSGWFNHDETAHCMQWLREAAGRMEASLLRDNDFMFFFLRYYAIPTSGIFSSPAA